MNNKMLVAVAVVLGLTLANQVQAREWTPEEAVRQSIQASQVLREYQARSNQSRFQYDEIDTGNNPTLNLNGSYSYLTPTVAFQAGPSSVISSVAYNYNLSLSFRQLITNFGQLESALEASRLAQEVSKWQTRDQEERLREETLVMFQQAALAEDLVISARAALKAREMALTESNHRFKAGNVSRYDVLRSQTLLAQARQSLVEAEKESRTARHQLFLSMGVPNTPAETLVVSQAQPESPPTDLAGATSLALQQRADVQAALTAHQEAQARVDQTARSNSPRLELQSDYLRRTGTAIQSDQQWTVAVALVVPIFDGGVTAAKTDKAREVANQYEAIYLNSCRQAEKELAGFFEELQAKFSAIETATTALESAREAARIAQLRYRAGLSTLVEFSEAESALIEAETNLKKSRHQYQIAAVHWKRACGTNL
jgi:OMF family outer membrane factor